jgi:hypothetical protein
MLKLSFAISTRDVYSTYQFKNVITSVGPIPWIHTFGNFTDFIDNSRELLVEIEYDPISKYFMPLRPIIF